MLQTGGQRHLFAEVPGQIKSLDVSVPLCVAADLLPCVVGAAIVDAQDFVIAGEFIYFSFIYVSQVLSMTCILKLQA